MRTLLAQGRAYYEQHERYITAGALLLGFVIDNLTLTRIDLLFDNLVLLTYLLLAAGGIAFFNLIREGYFRAAILKRLLPFFPLLAQFAFGGLLSGYFIFYSRSASSIFSWLFVLALALLLVGNERFKNQYLRFRVQVSMLFIAIFSFSIFSLPVLLKSIGPLIFILSGIVSVLFIVLFVYGLYRLIPERVVNARTSIAAIVGGIYILFNILYFGGAIPPLPLSLKDIGVYHSVSRLSDEGYRAIYEKPPWYLFFRNNNGTFHRVPGESVTVFSAVFAPTDLDAPIVHEWQYFDDARQRWVTTDRLTFPIIGGRDGGYRGFSTKTGVFEGEWRVDVTTEHGQIIGSTRFSIVSAKNPVTLEEKTL